jgi:hypothetical protein
MHERTHDADARMKIPWDLRTSAPTLQTPTKWLWSAIKTRKQNETEKSYPKSRLSDFR